MDYFYVCFYIIIDLDSIWFNILLSSEHFHFVFMKKVRFLNDRIVSYDIVFTFE